MSKFKEQEIDLGVIRSVSNVLFNFETLGNINDDIVAVTPGCGGCTDILGYDGRFMKVRFRSGSFPVHIMENFYFVTKSITVSYKDGSSEVLRYRAKIIK